MITVRIHVGEVDLTVSAPSWGGGSLSDVTYALEQVQAKALRAYAASLEDDDR